MFKCLNIDTEDGVVRVSMTHYNELDESLKLIQILKNIN